MRCCISYICLYYDMLHKTLTAPHFLVKDVYDRVIDLNDFKNNKLLIAFFRHAGCPFCNLRVHALTRLHPELKARGLEMIFFFESKQQVIVRSSFHQGVSPIPIVADPEKKIYTLYGIENSPLKSGISHLTSFVQTAYKASKVGVPIHLMESGESIATMPAEFLVEPGLKLSKVHYSQRLNDRLDLSVIKAFAD